jgi:uncharacterized zinc-type alcohol dehydrogenase-like protein
VKDHSITLSTPTPADEVFGLLLHPARFAAADIASVEPSAEGDRYALRFRGGLARWTQRTEADHAARVLRFEQVSGDFTTFGGSWEVTPDGTGSRVVHRVAFRTSVPHLAGAIEPMIARVLLRAAADVVDGLAGPAEIVEGTLHDEIAVPSDEEPLVATAPRRDPAPSVAAYAAPSPGAPLEPATITRRPLRPSDVAIAIHYCGVCHSDVHQVHGDWGGGTFPMVPGHEITGIVTAIGSDVTRHAVGDSVGVGVIVGSCRDCAKCAEGLEQYCPHSVETYAAVDPHDGEPTRGGYSTHIVTDEHFVLRIPDALPLDQAAPLLCAGITTYSPLKHWKAGPGKKVAVLGLGGLGHLAVKIAHAMGAEVTVLSRSLRKKDDGLNLGADHFHATDDPATFTELAGTFDLIVCTVSTRLDVDAYLSLLANGGTMVYLGITDEPLDVSVFSLLRGRASLAGSQIGGMAETQEMLDFCAEHGIGADVEVIEAAQVNEAFDRVRHGDVRYRFVIDASTI